jgi:hypothetical protein
MLELEKDIQKNIADAYIVHKDYEKAIPHLMEYIKLNDSLLKTENRKIVYDAGAKYETEKKEMELQMANKDKQLKDAEIERQKFIRNAIILGAILLMIILLMIFNNAIQQLINKSKYKNS